MHIRESVRYKDVWAEASGALGDLGTFVPIAIALTLVNGLDLGTTLLFTGAYNIVTGLLFGVPMPVQPMKSIAAVAISQTDPLSLSEIAAAGLSTAGLMFFLGITGLMGFVQRILPMPLVRGIQLSQGISFGKTTIDDGHGDFSGVRNIREVLGDYAAGSAHGAAVKAGTSIGLTKGEVSLGLTGTGRGWDIGVDFSNFSIEAE